MMCVAMEDPGLIVMPTHRLFRGLPAMTSAGVGRQARRLLHDPAGRARARRRRHVWEDIETGGDQGTLGPVHAEGPALDARRLTEAGRARMAEVAKEHTRPVAGVGRGRPAPAADRETCWAASDLPKPSMCIWSRKWSRGCGRASSRWPPGHAGHGRPTFARSASGERMPAKSTYFYPKLLSGLVINPLE